METKELKFLLKLLGCANYRSAASSLKGITEKDKLCRDLGERGLVDFSREIATVKILPAGRALLKLDTANLPITAKELKILETISKSSVKIPPSKITSVKANEREKILENIAERGLIEVEKKLKKTKAEVWITEQGIEYLQNDYNPKGTATISLDLLNNYLVFLRKSLQVQSDGAQLPPISTASETISKISDEEILQTIQHLDQELGTENYLPIFHLRQKLQPNLSREQLDQSLYRLQKHDQIELRTLVHAQDYTGEQVNSGISQGSGSPLFFIKVTAN
jgi:predicted transcriptional regulator